MNILLVLISIQLASAKGEPVFVNRVALEAEKNMNQVLNTPYADLKTEEEKRNWSGAALAKIALKRLQGRESEAAKVFESCPDSCRKLGNASEWIAANAWACAKGLKSAQCPEKTKTRKPPQ